MIPDRRSEINNSHSPRKTKEKTPRFCLRNSVISAAYMTRSADISGLHIFRRVMRIRMKTLMTFLALIVGVFMVGDLFLFSNVGRHGQQDRVEVQDSPYHIGDVKFIKRQIKSGREYISEGIKTFADKLYEGADDSGGEDGRYSGVRDSVMGAMDIPGMRQKFLPVEVDTKESDVFGGDVSKVRDLERNLMDGTLREEDIQDSGHEEVIREDYEELDEEFEEDYVEDVPEDGDNELFNWGNLFGFGTDEQENTANVEEDNINTDQEEFASKEDVLGVESINVPGMDDRILSKLNFQPDLGNDIFQKKPVEPIEEASEEELEDQWLFSQLKDIKGLADSVPEWPMEERPVIEQQPEIKPTIPFPETTKTTGSAYSFIASLFQPLRFAGSTGDDDENDGGWASVGDLDSLVDSVQNAIVPGMQQKVLIRQSPGQEPELFNKADVPVPAQVEEVPFDVIPGFGQDFFKKFEKGEEVPSMENMDVQPAVPSDQLHVPAIPGVSDEFFKKFSGEVPEQTAGGTAEEIQVPNIPGLSDDFFGKYGGAKLQEPGEIGPIFPDAMNVPQVPGLSVDFFNKFIHPVAKGQGVAAMPQVDNMIVESLEDVPGLPDDFFEKYVKEQDTEEKKVSGQGLRDQGFNIPDIPGLSDYLEKYTKEDGQAAIPLAGLKESLLRAQMQVPGMPEKVIIEDGGGMAPDLLDVVPPSDLPELQIPGRPSSPGTGQGIFALLLSAFARKKDTSLPKTGPLYQPEVNMTAPGGTAENSLEWPPNVGAGDPEEGFRLRNMSDDTIDMSEILRILVPNMNISVNDTSLLVHPGDALSLLNQLQGVAAAEVSAGLGEQPMRADLAEELANITALEDSRVVHCNMTKSSLWKVAITDRWHTVQDGLMFVYSSYLDDRIQGHTAIRILGILEGWEVGMHLKPFCQIWFQDKDDPFVIGATYEWLPGQPIAKFKAVLLTCVYQTSHVQGKPLAVSLTTEPCEEPKFLVKIHTRNETVGIKKTNFTICLTGPMKFGYADVGQFIQWMEFNIMMGVERFVLYNHSMDATLRPYLVHYAKLGYVQLFPWIIPDNIPNPLVFLKNLGHLAMINDCLYRNMWTSKYVIFMDIDEMILPRYGHVTFEPMLKNAGCDVKPQAVVQSVFFRREWPNDELFSTNQTVINMGLVGLLKTKRERKIWPPYMRSKYFIKPDEVLITNVHAAHSFLSPLDYQDLSCIFNPKEVILHHYRYWGEVTGNYVVDRRLHEYGDDLINRASNIYEAVLGRKVT